MRVAKKAGRLRRIKYDLTTLRIDNNRYRRTCDDPDASPGERPSDIIRRAKSEMMYLLDEQDTKRALEAIERSFSCQEEKREK
ncbi:MAG: hypothetical protein HY764_04455 [Candidatus Portnoybacteria bacterium]|nr:hypothetical protein [Candidatus Portnoybacteria bacterium]